MIGERGVLDLDLDLDLAPGDGGSDVSRGLKGFWLAKFAFGEREWASIDCVG